VNFTEHLQEILDWIASHGKRLLADHDQEKPVDTAVKLALVK
jgi:hypothetical protein